MDAAVTLVGATLLCYAVIEGLLQRTAISGAIVFTAVGLLASTQVTGLIDVSGTTQRPHSSSSRWWSSCSPTPWQSM